ncbi:hypothetical protein Csa_004102 [Cucumis sativus]|nr:hypothetical protein Csa_021371 [Cucumis sativus]KAE8647439.1 hypothetical protein Csa_004102 [Cucumis sativus]
MCTPLGPYGPCDDSDAPYVKEIAERAVADHNKSAGTNYTLVSIVNCESVVVSGTNYRLVLSLKDDSTTSDFLVVVYYRPWDNYLEVECIN